MARRRGATHNTRVLTCPPLTIRSIGRRFWWCTSRWRASTTAPCPTPSSASCTSAPSYSSTGDQQCSPKRPTCADRRTIHPPFLSPPRSTPFLYLAHTDCPITLVSLFLLIFSYYGLLEIGLQIERCARALFKYVHAHRPIYLHLPTTRTHAHTGPTPTVTGPSTSSSSRSPCSPTTTCWRWRGSGRRTTRASCPSTWPLCPNRQRTG